MEVQTRFSVSDLFHSCDAAVFVYYWHIFFKAHVPQEQGSRQARGADITEMITFKFKIKPWRAEFFWWKINPSAAMVLTWFIQNITAPAPQRLNIKIICKMSIKVICKMSATPESEGHIERTNYMHSPHDGIITWKRFPRYWSFERGIHRPPIRKGHTAGFGAFFDRTSNAWLWYSLFC